ncbi:DNA-directed RNA polymerase II subunit RPB3 [Capsicum annuum]|uniref:DNA-directed RNA polymerase II subunit RPB3 n=1 Tax=Capsicum annuum TaxID=4072 RepID=A0A2G2Y9L7_CAPAN|nr:DNA-directed RNA polymerase II subunit RPB3 [Capsicum annuum]
MKFELRYTDSSIANTLHRIMIAEVPTIAIDLVEIEVNSSVLNDKFISHYLGLILLTSERAMSMRFSRDCDACDGDGQCEYCSVEFYLRSETYFSEISNSSSIAHSQPNGEENKNKQGVSSHSSQEFDLNSLKDDPGERTPILEFRPNDRDAIRRAYLLKNLVNLNYKSFLKRRFVELYIVLIVNDMTNFDGFEIERASCGSY